MGNTTTIEHRMAQAYKRWGISLQRKNGKEACGPCPLCPLADDDGFLVFDNGGYWCRQCGAKGWLDEEEVQAVSKEQQLEWRVARLEAQQQEHERRLTLLEQMAQSTDHLRYHEGLTDEAMGYWLAEGVTEDSIGEYLLGYCPHCPTYPASDSYTIPVVNSGKLENIRHRLRKPDGGKYRPHMAGLGTQLFNADLLDEQRQRVLVVEGSKKAIIMTQSGFPAVAVMGKRAFRREWLERFASVGVVYIALDPDAKESAERLAGLFGGRARVVDMPVKPDDAVVRYGAGADDIEGFLRWARPV